MIDQDPKVSKSDLGQVSLDTKISQPAQIRTHVYFTDTNDNVMSMQHYTYSTAPIKNVHLT